MLIFCGKTDHLSQVSHLSFTTVNNDKFVCIWNTFSENEHKFVQNWFVIVIWAISNNAGWHFQSRAYVGVSNFLGGDQLPIPTRYKMSVWGGDQSPPPHVKFLAWGGPVPPPRPRVVERTSESSQFPILLKACLDVSWSHVFSLAFWKETRCKKQLRAVRICTFSCHTHTQLARLKTGT